MLLTFVDEFEKLTVSLSNPGNGMRLLLLLLRVLLTFVDEFEKLTVSLSNPGNGLEFKNSRTEPIGFQDNNSYQTDTNDTFLLLLLLWLLLSWECCTCAHAGQA